MSTDNGPDAALAVVERGGPLATIQDLGRAGGRREGWAPGGAMDRSSCLWANHLLGNDPNDALLEITLGGIVLRFECDTTVAITGADCGVTLDGAPLSPWRTVRVVSGQRLRFGYARNGMRSYLALSGGLATRRVFGSASMVAREQLPGLLGRALRPGDRLRWHAPNRTIMTRSVPPKLVPSHLVGRGGVTATAGGTPAEADVAIPLVLGYECDLFSESDRARLFDSDWTVDAASNRTALLLAGPALLSGPRVLDSAPLVDGTLQVTGAGSALVFMRDRPTIGGYAKLGAVSPTALDVLAQTRPGASIRFVQADREESRRLMARQEMFFGIRSRLA